MRPTFLAVAAALLVALPAQSSPRPRRPEPPDPRRGERLDGRSAPEDPSRVALAVPRLLLAGPRLAIKAVLMPVVKATAFVEERRLIPRASDTVTSDDGKVGVRPDLRYDSSFGVALGARYFDERTLGEQSMISVRARGGGSGKLFGEFRLQGPYGLIGMRARYERNPVAIFAGLRGETLEELEAMGLGRSRYEYDRGLVELDSELPLHRLVKVRLVGGLEMAAFDAGSGRSGDAPLDEVYDPAMIPGFEDGTRLVRGGAEVHLDTRREKRYGTGFALSTGGYYSRGVLDDPSDFTTVVGEGRFFLGLHDRALVFRLRSGLIERTGDAPVPFDQLLSPTGSDGMRGLSSGVRRGPSELVGSVEYQWLVSANIDALVFVDHGGAFEERFDGLAWDRLEPSVGVGLRHLRSARPYWRGIPDSGIQLAWAPDHGFHFLFAVGL